jgi:glycosyltransferase involved in cell wall biosynthesis
MKVALLCSGLGHISRGHEVFARDLFTLLRGSADITLFKGGGKPTEDEYVIDNLPRLSSLLAHVHVDPTTRWHDAIQEQERIRIEGETFAYAALKPLMEGEYDIVHCLEQEVCNVLYANRHLFAKPPKIVFSNGGAIPAHKLPRCDFVQEHTDYNYRRSDRRRAFMIPHGVNLDRFQPGIPTSFRLRHGIPEDGFLALSVGTICHWHKRMDHVISELSQLPDVHLAIVGQHGPETAAIMALGHQLMPGRVIFDTLPHDNLPEAYAAADCFVLGSLFETFGIVYIEAMAMGLPVVCTSHPNQRSIVGDGVFVDMAKPGALRDAVRDRRTAEWRRLAEVGQRRVKDMFDLRVLQKRYLERYQSMAAAPTELPRITRLQKLRAHLGNAIDKTRHGLRSALP